MNHWSGLSNKEVKLGKNQIKSFIVEIFDNYERWLAIFVRVKFNKIFSSFLSFNLIKANKYCQNYWLRV